MKKNIYMTSSNCGQGFIFYITFIKYLKVKHLSKWIFYTKGTVVERMDDETVHTDLDCRPASGHSAVTQDSGEARAAGPDRTSRAAETWALSAPPGTRGGREMALSLLFHARSCCQAAKMCFRDNSAPGRKSKSYMEIVVRNKSSVAFSSVMTRG